MTTPRGAWLLSGVLAGLAGLATSHAAAMLLTIRATPVVAIGEMVIRLTPGPVVELAIRTLGQRDKPVLMGGIFVLTFLAFAWTGMLARRSWWAPLLVYVALAAIAAVAVLWRPGAMGLDVFPVVIGFVTWVIALSVLTDPWQRMQHHVVNEEDRNRPDIATSSRRSFLGRTALVGAATLAFGLVGNAFGRGRREVEETRRLLKLPITRHAAFAGTSVGVDGVEPWRTPNGDFYRIHTALVVPSIAPKDWELRIHGLVDRELTLSYQDLLDREITEAWITLNCVSNSVGGDLIGNAWWSGVRLATLLEEAGVQPGADAVLQTSHDGWNCGTPLAALTDDRNSMLAIGMNGVPLPIDHGFPVRTVVPGLYGYVSACKWVVEMEVTRFDQIEAFWTQRGWSERGPVKLASRIDAPRGGDDLDAGTIRIGGSAWAQHTGVKLVEYSLDEGPWIEAGLGRVPNVDTWVQWVAELEVEPGDHTLAVRATDANGNTQTSDEAPPEPNGATGWHTIEFEVSE